MQLKYNKSVRNNVITIELETANFTPDENKALDRFGEPEVRIEKLYGGKWPVNFAKKIRNGFKVKVKFDGSEGIEAATEAANMFFDEIQEELAEEMAKVMDIFNGNDFEVKTGIVDVKY